MPDLRSSVLGRCNPWLVAVAAACLGILIRLAIPPQGAHLLFLGPFLAILLAAWYGGFWPGMLATAICAIWAVLHPVPVETGGLTSPALRVALLVPAGVLICLLAGHLHRNRREADLRTQGMHRLARSSQRLQAALELAAISAFDVDCELRYVWVQKPPVGLREADMLGKRAEEIYEPAVAATLTAARKQILQTGKSFRTEMLVTRGGVTEWVDWIGGPLRDADGNLIGVTNLAIDITDRKLSELAIRRNGEAQRLLVELQDATRDLTSAADIKAAVVGRLARFFQSERCVFADIDVAQGTAEVSCDYTSSAPSLVGHHPLAPPDCGPMQLLLAGRAVALSGSRQDEAWMIPGRSTTSGALLCVPILHDGKLAAALSLRQSLPRVWSEDEIRLVHQVAQRSWSAIESARAQEALRESRDVLALAMRGGRMGAWSREFNSDRTWWSRELLEIFGLEREGFSGTREDFLALLHPEDRARVQDAFVQALRRHSDFLVEYRFRHKSGEWRWMEGRGRAVYRSDGTPRATYGLGIDITERKSLENERRRLNTELAQTLRHKDDFLATLAHELRNPLAPIVTALEVLRLKAPADVQARWSRDVIERQVRHMTRLVEDLLDVTRIATGKTQLRKERIVLSGVVHHAVESVKGQIDAAGHQLSLALPAQTPLLEADPTRLSQVLANLLSNAAKYTPPGGRIALEACRDGSQVVISVSDNGIGLLDADRERIFRMFAQVMPAIDRSQGGLGIGLALSRGLVELHGGSIDAESAGPGQGSRFIVRLPCATQALPVVTPPGLLPGPDTGEPAPAACQRILIVDDNLDAAQSLAMLLELDGHDIAMAHDGQHALETAKSFAPQTILLDIGLPVMNGYEVARRLRAQPWGREIRLIAVTGWGQERDRQQAMAAGFDHHLTKPLDPGRLSELLELSPTN